MAQVLAGSRLRVNFSVRMLAIALLDEWAVPRMLSLYVLISRQAWVVSSISNTAENVDRSMSS